MILVYGDSKYHIIVRMLISHHIWPLTSIKPVVTGGFKHSEYAGPPQSECINLFPLVGGSANYSSCQTDSVTQKNILITFNLKHSRVWKTCESCSFIKWRIRDILTYPTTHICSIRGMPAAPASVSDRSISDTQNFVFLHFQPHSFDLELSALSEFNICIKTAGYGCFVALSLTI